MKNFRFLLYFLMLMVLSKAAFAQDQSSEKVFTEDQLIWYVENYHPVSVRANLVLKSGESTLRKARGNFDPTLMGQFNEKEYEDKSYYRLLNTGLKVPTWYGIELKTGFDENSGQFLNPQNNLPDGGLWYGGLSVTLGQGLFIDQRRASLRQAKIFAQSTESEQQLIMNQLYFEALKTYWKWTESWNAYRIFEESVEIASIRFEAVKQSYRLGDLPAIDTLEAFIQLQNRQMNRNEAQLNYQNMSLELSNFLWFENNTPLEITDSIHPREMDNITLEPIIAEDSLQLLLSNLENIHPEMQLYQYKLATMDIERRLKQEKLKPTINLNYNALTEPIGNEFYSDISTQNYRWGVELNFPLFLREARGDLQLTKIKLQDTELSRQQKLLELQNKLNAYYNEQLNLEGQLTLFSNAVDNYENLLDGERTKFDIGESSLFLVNSRESNYIQSRIKLMQLKAKFNISRAGLRQAAGNLYPAN